MSKQCVHLDEMKVVQPSANGCEDCLKIGDSWVHLCLCLECGHVGCCLFLQKINTLPSTFTPPSIPLSNHLSWEKIGAGVTPEQLEIDPESSAAFRKELVKLPVQNHS